MAICELIGLTGLRSQRNAQSITSPINSLLSPCSQNNHLYFIVHNPYPEIKFYKKICMCAPFITFQSYHSCLLNWPKAVNEDVYCNIDWNSFKKKERFLVSCTIQKRHTILHLRLLCTAITIRIFFTALYFQINIYVLISKAMVNL